MLIERRRAVSREITTALTDIERQIDAVLVTHATLIAAVIEGRRSANLPLDAGQAGLDKITEALPALIAARKAIHAAHYSFRETRDSLRLPVHAYGDTGDTPGFANKGELGVAPALALVDAA